MLIKSKGNARININAIMNDIYEIIYIFLFNYFKNITYNFTIYNNIINNTNMHLLLYFTDSTYQQKIQTIYQNRYNKMKEICKTYKEAVSFTRQKRSIINPNKGFERQLIRLEKKKKKFKCNVM
jgi:hypothetical protein